MEGLLLGGIYSEGEAAVVAILKALLQRHHSLEQGGVHSKRGDRREQPAVVWGGGTVRSFNHVMCQQERTTRHGATGHRAQTRAPVLLAVKSSWR